MQISVEEHEHRLYLPALCCSLPKEVAGCRYSKTAEPGDGGAVMRYRFHEILTADIFVYDDDAEYVEDGVDLEVFRHFQICKAGIEAIHLGTARLLSEAMYCVREYPDERQFCCAVFELPSSEIGQPPLITHLF